MEGSAGDAQYVQILHWHALVISCEAASCISNVAQHEPELASVHEFAVSFGRFISDVQIGVDPMEIKVCGTKVACNNLHLVALKVRKQ